jgi:hypothetical protein
LASKNSSCASIAPRAPQGCGSGVHNEAGGTHRTRMVFPLYNHADLEIDAHLSTSGDDTMTTITMTPKLQAALIRLRDADAKLRVTPTPTGIIRVAETKQAETTYINAYQAWITAAETVSKIIK